LDEPFKNIARTGHGAFYLKLRCDYLPTLTAALFEGLIVIHLIAHHCNISSIEETTFAHLSNTLESIDLSENSLTQVNVLE